MVEIVVVGETSVIGDDNSIGSDDRYSTTSVPSPFSLQSFAPVL